MLAHAQCTVTSLWRFLKIFLKISNVLCIFRCGGIWTHNHDKCITLYRLSYTTFTNWKYYIIKLTASKAKLNSIHCIIRYTRKQHFGAQKKKKEQDNKNKPVFRVYFQSNPIFLCDFIKVITKPLFSSNIIFAVWVHITEPFHLPMFSCWSVVSTWTHGACFVSESEQCE